MAQKCDDDMMPFLKIFFSNTIFCLFCEGRRLEIKYREYSSLVTALVYKGGVGYVHRVDFEFFVAFYVVVVVARRKAFSLPKRSFESFFAAAAFFGFFSFSREEALEEEDGKKMRAKVVFFFGCSAMPKIG